MTYSELQASILDWLARPDLSTVVLEFIENAEARLNRDPRVRQLTARIAFPIDADGEDVPADLRAIDSLYLDGPIYYGPINIVGGDVLPRLKLQGTTGPPTAAAVLGRKLYFAPAIAAEYDALISYYLKVPTLSDAEPTNWLLDDHPDIYRLAALVESAPYLQDDQRLPMWESMLSGRLEDLFVSSQQEAFSGTLTRTAHPLGG